MLEFVLHFVKCIYFLLKNKVSIKHLQLHHVERPRKLVTPHSAAKINMFTARSNKVSGVCS